MQKYKPSKIKALVFIVFSLITILIATSMTVFIFQDNKLESKAIISECESYFNLLGKLTLAFVGGAILSDGLFIRLGVI